VIFQAFFESDAPLIAALPRAVSHGHEVPMSALLDILRVLRLHGATIDVAPDAHQPAFDIPPVERSVRTLTQIDGGWGYRDATGILAIPGPYLEAHPFVKERAVVKIGVDEWALIDDQGRVICQDLMAVHDMPDGSAWVAHPDPRKPRSMRWERRDGLGMPSMSWMDHAEASLRTYGLDPRQWSVGTQAVGALLMMFLIAIPLAKDTYTDYLIQRCGMGDDKACAYLDAEGIAMPATLARNPVWQHLILRVPAPQPKLDALEDIEPEDEEPAYHIAPEFRSGANLTISNKTLHPSLQRKPVEIDWEESEYMSLPTCGNALRSTPLGL